MNEPEQKQRVVAVIGAGPAGIYGTRKLLEAGHRVVLLNRDVKPGGLAEYGIFLDKYKMKEGLRKQFRKILGNPNVSYLGHVTVGDDKDLSLAALAELGFSAVVVSAGAQGTKKLGLPGEDCVGVYHAKDVVYHFNQLPPFSQQPFAIGEKVAIIGMGNVMVDVAHWLLLFKKVKEVLVVARRGPAEKAYDDKEFRVIEPFLDAAAMRSELERIAPSLEACGQNVKEVAAKLCVEHEGPSDQRLRFRYLSSPTRVVPDERGRTRFLRVEENKLEVQNGRTVARGTGQHTELDVDTVIYAIGDQVDPSLGLPFSGGVFVTSPQDNAGNPSPGPYQAYDPKRGQVLDGVFLVGWARKASDGLVGVARQDAERGMKFVNEYLSGQPGFSSGEIEEKIKALVSQLTLNKVCFVTRSDVAALEAREKEEAAKRGLPEYKYPSDEEMLAVIEDSRKASPQVPAETGSAVADG